MSLTTEPTSCPGSYAPLSLTRDTVAFEHWWATLTDTSDIVDAIDALHAPQTSDVESSLHWLMITVFQDVTPVPWLEVHGLQPTARPSHVVLDVEVAHDSDGDCVGVNVVLSLHVTGDDGTVVATTPSAYVQWPAKTFAPTNTEPGAALGKIIDTALDLINTTIATADRFATLARSPYGTDTTAADPQEDGDDDPEVETCRDCGRVTRIDDEPVDTDAADGWDGYCGSCADRREGGDAPDE